MAEMNPNDPSYWDKTAASYETMAAPFTAQFADDALDLLSLAPGASLIDVATGTGAAAVSAARRGASVTAIDFSPSMIERVLAQGIAAIDVRVMDGQNLAFPAAHFDAAVSVFGVFLFPDWRAGLREMARVVKPGGRVAVAVWKNPLGAGIQAKLAAIGKALFPDVSITTPFGGLTDLADAGRLERAFQDAGLSGVRIAESTHDFVVPASVLDDHMQNFANLPAWRALNEGQRAAVLAEARASAAREGRDGLWPIPATALIASGRRD